MEFTSIFLNILTLFVMIGIGYAAYKINFITRPGLSQLSSLLVNILLPCLIIDSMQIPLTVEHMNEMEWIFVIEGIYYIIALITALIVVRFMAGSIFETGVLKFMFLFSNLGFMGYPIANAAFGENSYFYVTLINLPFSLVVFTIGIYLIKPGQNIRDSIKNLISPGLFASVLGLLFFFLEVNIPPPLSGAIELIGGTTTPLAMIVIGALLATLPVSYIVTDKRIFIVSLFRLIILPLILFIVIRSFVISPMLIAIPVLLAAMPVAANAVLLAEEYGANSELASKGVFLSTFLSLFTIPAFCILLTSLF